jgi:hypothetical protein
VSALAIKWDDEPTGVRAAERSIWCRTTFALQSRPGQWAIVLTDATAAYARESAAKCLRRLGCQVKTRTTTDDGKVSVWARWPEARALPTADAQGYAPSTPNACSSEWVA